MTTTWIWFPALLYIIAFSQTGHTQYVNLTTVLTEICPRTIFNCMATLTDDVLRWFRNSEEIARYTLSEQNPPVSNVTLNTSISGVEIKVLSAIVNEEGGTFHSIMTVDNIQSFISDEFGCGSIFLTATLVVLTEMITVPETLDDVSAEPRYDKDFELYEIKVTWKELVIVGNFCSYKSNYTAVILEATSGVEVEREAIGFTDNCDNQLMCSTILTTPVLNQTHYNVCISATSFMKIHLPTSCYEYPILGILGSSFNYSLPFENSCSTEAECSTTLSEEGNCTINYGQDPFYQNFEGSFIASFNNPIFLPLKNPAIYSIEIVFTIQDFGDVIVRRNITTNGNGTRSIEFAAIIISVLAFFILIGVIVTFSAVLKIQWNKDKCSISFPAVRENVYLITVIVLAILMTTILVILWILASIQEDACNQQLQYVIIAVNIMAIIACSILPLISLCRKNTKSYNMTENNDLDVCPKCLKTVSKSKKYECGECNEAICKDCSKRCRGLFCQTRVCDPCFYNVETIDDKVRVEYKEEYYEERVMIILYRVGQIKIFPLTVHNKSKKLWNKCEIDTINISEISKISAASNRPSILHCIEIQLSSGKKYMLSIKSEKLKYDWINLIQKRKNSKFQFERGDHKDIEYNIELPCKIGFQTRGTLSFEEKFMIVTSSDVRIYDSITNTEEDYSIEKSSILWCDKMTNAETAVESDVDFEVKFEVEEDQSDFWFFKAKSQERQTACITAIRKNLY